MKFLFVARDVLLLETVAYVRACATVCVRACACVCVEVRKQKQKEEKGRSIISVLVVSISNVKQ